MSRHPAPSHSTPCQADTSSDDLEAVLRLVEPSRCAAETMQYDLVLFNAGHTFVRRRHGSYYHSVHTNANEWAQFELQDPSPTLSHPHPTALHPAPHLLVACMMLPAPPPTLPQQEFCKSLVAEQRQALAAAMVAIPEEVRVGAHLVVASHSHRGEAVRLLDCMYDCTIARLHCWMHCTTAPRLYSWAPWLPG